MGKVVSGNTIIFWLPWDGDVSRYAKPSIEPSSQPAPACAAYWFAGEKFLFCVVVVGGGDGGSSIFSFAMIRYKATGG